MKLNQRTEWALIVALIAYLAFTPGLQLIRDILSNPVGKAAALLGIVYVWKKVSAILAVLLALGYIRCASKGNVWEGLEMPSAVCTCENGFNFDAATKKCVGSKGEVKDPVACTCPTGYTYDSQTKECKQVSEMTEAVPPPPPPAPEATASTPETAAPATNTGVVTSTAPITTPGAAQAMASTAPPATPPATGPAASEGFVGGYSKW
jgi:hypothetical protein